jgi:hypothetical protein
MLRFRPMNVCHLTKDSEPGSRSNEPSGRCEKKRAEMAATGCRPFSALVARETIELVLLSIGRQVCPTSKCTPLKLTCRGFICSVVGGSGGSVERKPIGASERLEVRALPWMGPCAYLNPFRMRHHPPHFSWIALTIIQVAHDQPRRLAACRKRRLCKPTSSVSTVKTRAWLSSQVSRSSRYGSALATFRCRVAAALRSRSETSPSLTHRWGYFTLPHDLRLPAGHQRSTSEFLGIGGPLRNHVDLIGCLIKYLEGDSSEQACLRQMEGKMQW